MSHPSSDGPTEVRIGISSLTPADQQPPFVEPIFVPEAMIDGIAGIQVVNGILHLALFAERQSVADNKNVRLVVARIALSPVAANLVAETIKGVLDSMVGSGVLNAFPTTKVTMASDEMSSK